jgi:hypothetical protein
MQLADRTREIVAGDPQFLAAVRENGQAVATLFQAQGRGIKAMLMPRNWCRYLCASVLLVAVSVFFAGCGSDDDQAFSDPPVSTDTTPPAAPSGVAVAGENMTVSLTWTTNQESDLASYYVYEAENSGEFELLTVIPGDLNSFSDTRDYGEYHYQVKAVDTSDNESEPSESVVVGFLRRPGARRPLDNAFGDDGDMDP